MERLRPKRHGGSEIHAVLRKRNQVTLPSEAIDWLGISEGDVLIIELKHNAAMLRPIKRSYAGALQGIYGDTQRYIEKERGDWE